MKEYLKMANYFHGQVSIDASGFISDDKYSRGSTDIAEDYYGPICHAINSHDELVQMNLELIAKLCEINGCFEAALDEGWIDAVANKDAYRIEDICRRRIDGARSIAAAALSGFSV